MTIHSLPDPSSYLYPPPPPPPESNMRLTVTPIMKDRKDAKRGKMNIGVGSLMTSEVGKMEKNTTEGGDISMRKDLVGCVQS